MLWCSATFHSGKSAMLLAPLVHLFENPAIKMNRGEMENECVINFFLIFFLLKPYRGKRNQCLSRGNPLFCGHKFNMFSYPYDNYNPIIL